MTIDSKDDAGIPVERKISRREFLKRAGVIGALIGATPTAVKIADTLLAKPANEISNAIDRAKEGEPAASLKPDGPDKLLENTYQTALTRARAYTVSGGDMETVSKIVGIPTENEAAMESHFENRVEPVTMTHEPMSGRVKLGIPNSPTMYLKMVDYSFVREEKGKEETWRIPVLEDEKGIRSPTVYNELLQGDLLINAAVANGGPIEFVASLHFVTRPDGSKVLFSINNEVISHNYSWIMGDKVPKNTIERGDKELALGVYRDVRTGQYCSLNRDTKTGPNYDQQNSGRKVVPGVFYGQIR